MATALRMPIAGWYNWSGECIEGRGVAPEVEADLSHDELRAERDLQLQRAVEELTRDRAWRAH